MIFLIKQQNTIKKNSKQIWFKKLLFISTFFISFALLSEKLQATEEIKNLEYSNPQIVELRAEITENLKKSKSKKPIVITWRTYRVKKDDNFFMIMARTMQNQDTLASINNLTSLWDLSVGQVLYIPTARGVVEQGKKEELARKYSISPSLILSLPSRWPKDSYFIPGKLFSAQERNYFNLSAFIRPVEGRVSSPYGYRSDPFTHKQKFHKGIDIACPLNSVVKAAASGVVVLTNERDDYGKYIVIRHSNGYLTLYGHLNVIQVKKGQKVAQGQRIALSGSTGRSTGPHLHFEVRKSDNKTTLPRFRHQ